MKPTASPNMWRPLRTGIFRNLLIADVISDAGAFMQSVGAAWLMVSLGGGPICFALTQIAASLPYLPLALRAGSAGDIVDLRKLVLFTEPWMMWSDLRSNKLPWSIAAVTAIDGLRRSCTAGSDCSGSMHI